MERQIKLSSAQVPSLESVFFYELGEMIQKNADMSSVFKNRFKPNRNQARLYQLIEAADVPEDMPCHYLIWGPTGSGKTYSALGYALDKMLSYPGVRVLGVRATAKDLKNSLYKDVKEMLDKYNVPYKKNDTDLKIVLQNNSEFWMCSDKALVPHGSDKADSLGGTQFSIVIIEEADGVSEELCRTVPGRMRQRIGGFRKAIFYVCNPPSRNHYLFRWFMDPDNNDHEDPTSRYRVCFMPVEDNVEHVGEGYIQAITEDYAKDPVFYRRMRLGQFGPNLAGLPVFDKDFRPDWHVAPKPLQWNRGCGMLRSWDFGYRGTAVTVAQDDLRTRQIKVYRSILGQNVLLDSFADEILPELDNAFPGAIWEDYIDAAGRQKNTNGPSCVDILKSKGLRPRYKIATIAYGVNVIMEQLRLSINGRPVVWIDPSCEILIEALQGGYCNKKGVTDTEINPVKDGYYDHVMDSFRYLMVNIRKSGQNRNPEATGGKQEWAPLGSKNKVGPTIFNPGERKYSANPPVVQYGFGRRN